MLPPVFDSPVGIFFTIRHSHPADLYDSAVLCPEALRGIVIKSIVPNPVLSQMILAGNFSFQEEIPGLVYILVFPLASRKPLDRG